MEEADWWGASDDDGGNNSTPWSLRAYCAQRGPRWHLSKGGGLILVWWSLLPGVAGNSMHVSIRRSVRPSVHPFIHPSSHSLFHTYLLLSAVRPPGGIQWLTRQVPALTGNISWNAGAKEQVCLLCVYSGTCYRRVNSCTVSLHPGGDRQLKCPGVCGRPPLGVLDPPPSSPIPSPPLCWVT